MSAFKEKTKRLLSNSIVSSSLTGDAETLPILSCLSSSAQLAQLGGLQRMASPVTHHLSRFGLGRSLAGDLPMAVPLGSNRKEPTNRLNVSTMAVAMQGTRRRICFASILLFALVFIYSHGTARQSVRRAKA